MEHLLGKYVKSDLIFVHNASISLKYLDQMIGLVQLLISIVAK